MTGRSDSSRWSVVLVFLLTIARISGADEEVSYYGVYNSTSDIATAAQDSNGPTILPDSYKIHTFYERYYGPDNYRITASAEVHDPQGPNDIAIVKVIDADGNEFRLKDQGSGFYSGHRDCYSTPPPLGTIQIVAIDRSGNSDAVSDDLVPFQIN